MSYYLAVDLGAESGRVILGTISDGRLKLEELHRFANTPVMLPTGLYWDTLRLWEEILQGLSVAGRDRKLIVSGIGVDTWGVDFALLGADGALVDNPRHYRDARNNGMMEKTFEVAPKEQIFGATGIQFMQINSLYQWHAMHLSASPALQTARTLLFMPDLFNCFLTGQRRAERTIASTSQFYDPRAKTWAAQLLRTLGLNPNLLPPLIDPGTRLGSLLAFVADRTGLPAQTTVFATAGHDTACAVAAAPTQESGHWCYISSGTWSLMGVEIDEPVIDSKARELNFTNEIGAGGRVRLLKNIAGMWLLQECRRAWAGQGNEFSYEDLALKAAAAEPFAAMVDPDAFLEPGHMPQRIAEYCAATSQKAPIGEGALVRVILESLALRYRQVLESLESLTGKTIETIHIMGGGSRNQLLNQLVADATGRMVVAGPAEATAAGNILVQAIGSGEVAGLAEARQIVRNSFEVTAVPPRSRIGWDEAYRAFCRLTRL
ncbi:MAG: rhamnulokinase [Acidobacteriia bacterium]|nr:rhamnulokinase [Terriglobia bacterium]